MDENLIKKIDLIKCVKFGVKDVHKLFLDIEKLLIDGWMVLVGDKSGTDRFISHYIANLYQDHLKFYEIKADKVKMNLKILLAKKNEWYRSQLQSYHFDQEAIENAYMILFKKDLRLALTSSDNPFIIRNHVTQMIVEFLTSMQIGKKYIDECFKLKDEFKVKLTNDQ